MSFFARRKIKNNILMVNINNPNLDGPLTARQVLNLLATASGCRSLENAVLQESSLENIPENIREFFYETKL